MVSAETLLSCLDLKLPFTVHTDASDRQLVDVIIHNNKHIAFFFSKISKPQHSYTTTEKEILALVEFLKQFRGIISGCEINTFSYHKNLVYSATLSEYQRVMHWQLIIEEFGTNIQQIAGVYNLVADTLSRLPYTPSDKYESCKKEVSVSCERVIRY